MINGNKFKKTMLTILTAIMLAMSAGIVTADGSDPNDPSDGGADWDSDGLTNSDLKKKPQACLGGVNRPSLVK